MEKTVPELVLEIIYEHHKQTRQGLIQSEIVFEVAERKGIPAKDAKTIQPNVSKALSRFVKHNQVSKTSKGIYVPYDRSHDRIQDRENICNTVVFTNSEVFSVSENTLLLGVDGNSIHIAKALFKAYLGTELCFDVTIFGEYLALLLREDGNDLKQTRKDIEDIVKTAIAIYEKAKRKVKILKTNGQGIVKVYPTNH